LVMQVIKSKQLNIPHDVSIIGFTNEPVSQSIEPSLTTVSQPSYKMGEMAASLFIEQIQNKEFFVPVTKVLPTELVLRNSTRRVHK
jgi:DNA-binding LacI/PurR family transcriptional regulator